MIPDLVRKMRKVMLDNTTDYDQALWSKVQLILDTQKKISKEIICTKTTLEEVGTCPGGCKIERHTIL